MKLHNLKASIHGLVEDLNQIVPAALLQFNLRMASENRNFRSNRGKLAELPQAYS
jgi:hypothetical protein